MHTTEERFNDAMQSGRETAAEKINQAAGAIRDRASEYGDESKLKRAANRTADKMASAADYMRSHNAEDVWQDLTGFLRRHPTESVAVALVLGVLAGRSMRRG